MYKVDFYFLLIRGSSAIVPSGLILNNCSASTPPGSSLSRGKISVNKFLILLALLSSTNLSNTLGLANTSCTFFVPAR
uniref:Putative secreted protein n=1 Tax=Panstrongylus lignarius TaxID=156445 RepID=A0A224Y046_9HEMI